MADLATLGHSLPEIVRRSAHTILPLYLTEMFTHGPLFYR